MAKSVMDRWLYILSDLHVCLVLVLWDKMLRYEIELALTISYQKYIKESIVYTLSAGLSCMA